MKFIELRIQVTLEPNAGAYLRALAELEKRTNRAQATIMLEKAVLDQMAKQPIGGILAQLEQRNQSPEVAGIGELAIA